MVTIGIKAVSFGGSDTALMGSDRRLGVNLRYSCGGSGDSSASITDYHRSIAFANLRVKIGHLLSTRYIVIEHLFEKKPVKRAYRASLFERLFEMGLCGHRRLKAVIG
jgi:hypothetical protein